jgi:hypothetical protein
MVAIIIYLVTLLITVSVVGGASSAGYLNSALTRTVGGIGTQIVSMNWLYQYTNFESFIRYCLQGEVGIIGYAFILSLSTLVIVWTNNLIEYRQAIM